MDKKNILITGGSGMIGRAISVLLSPHYSVYAPTHSEMDIERAGDVNAYIATHMPYAIIHAAAYTDLAASENQRGDTSGSCWNVNVNGTTAIVEAAKRVGSYVIYISTGSVFSGTSLHPGPFCETDEPACDRMLSWYAITKAAGERIVQASGGAIVRLSHPLVPHSIGSGDYLQRMITLYTSHSLYPLFTDQQFPLTDMRALCTCLGILISQKRQGIYHTVSRDVVSPFELVSYALSMMRMEKHELKKIVFSDFIRTQSHPLRYSHYSAIDGSQTSSTLAIPPYTWRDVVDSSMA